MTWVLARASLRYVVFLTCDLGLINTCRSLLWSFEDIDISIQFCRAISNYMSEWVPAHHFSHVVLIPEHARGPGHALYVPNASRRDNLSRHRGPLIALLAPAGQLVNFQTLPPCRLHYLPNDFTSPSRSKMGRK